MGVQYYKVHGGRLSFAEYWRMSPDPVAFLVAAGMKLAGGMNFAFSIPRTDDLVELDWGELPGVARRALQDPRDRLERAGCELAFCHELPVLEAHRLGVGALFLAPGGTTYVNAAFVKDRATTRVAVGVVTRFDDDTAGVTSTERKQLRPRPDYRIQRHPGAPADELLDRHREHLQEWELAGLRPVRVTRQVLPGWVLESEQKTVDFHVGRGVFVPMSKAEIRHARDEAEGEQ